MPGSSIAYPRLTLELSLMALLLSLPDGVGPFFQWERALAFSEPWRWLSGHFTHWNSDHLIWDLIMFAAAGAYCELCDRRSFLICLGSSSLLILLGVMIFLPQIEQYRGLSGLDSALFVLMILQVTASLKPAMRWLAYTALVGFGSKLILEVVTGSSLFVQHENMFVPIPLSHLLGGLCGAITYFLTRKEVSIPAP